MTGKKPDDQNVIAFETRADALKRRRPELRDKDLRLTENLDIDAFKALFPSNPPTASAAQFMADRLREEHQRAEQAFAQMTEEERRSLGDGWLILID